MNLVGKIIFVMMSTVLGVFAGTAKSDIDIRNGGDVVECTSPGELEGWFSLDYVATYNVRTKNADIEPVNSWESSAARIKKILDEKMPVLSRSFEEYLASFENYGNQTARRQWRESSFGLVDLVDESLLSRLPLNCGASANGKAVVQQVIVRRNSGSLLEYYVDPTQFNKLKSESPLQLSFLAIHEWGWDLTSNVQTLRNFVRYLHSKFASEATTEEFVRTLELMGIPDLDYLAIRRPLSSFVIVSADLVMSTIKFREYKTLSKTIQLVQEDAFKLEGFLLASSVSQELVVKAFENLSKDFKVLKEEFYKIHVVQLNQKIDRQWSQILSYYYRVEDEFDGR